MVAQLGKLRKAAGFRSFNAAVKKVHSRNMGNGGRGTEACGEIAKGINRLPTPH